MSSHFHLSSSISPDEVLLPHPYLSARTRSLRFLSRKWAPYPQRQPESPRRATEQGPAAPCSPSRTSRRAQCPEKSGARSLSGSAPRKRRGDGTCAAAQGFGALRARVPQLPARPQERLRCQSEGMIPAAGQLLALRGAQVMPRAGRGNATMHLRLSRSPGTQCWVGARAETLERGAGLRGAGLPFGTGAAPQPGSVRGSPPSRAHSISASPPLAPNCVWPRVAPGRTARVQQPRIWQKENVARSGF